MKLKESKLLVSGTPYGNWFDYFLHYLEEQKKVYRSLISGWFQEEYLYNRSGDKEVTPLIEDWYNNVTGGIRDGGLTSIIIKKFDNKWTDLYNYYYDLASKIDPLNNYKVTEIRTPDLTKTEAGTSTNESKRSTNTNTSTSSNDSGTDKIYGFNSEEGVNSNSSTSESNETTIGSADDNYSINTGSNTNTTTKQETGTETKTKEGYILSNNVDKINQYLINKYRDLFLEVFYDDLDSVLTRDVYVI